MSNDSDYRTVAVVAVCVTTLLAVGAGVVASDSLDAEVGAAVQETTTDRETTPGQETTEDQQADGVSIRNFSAPAQVAAGESYTVSAEVVNEGDGQAVRRVAYRIGGNVIDFELVEISTDGATTVTFDVGRADTSGFPAETFTHGVFTEDAEATANLTFVADEGTTPEETTTEEIAEVSVTFENQTTNGSVLVVDSVTVPEGGFVVVHDASIFDGAVVESIVGQSDYLEAGTQQNVTVELDDSLNGSQRLVAVAYRDSNGNETFDLVTSNRTADGPYRLPGREVAVSDVANVTVEDDGQEESR